MDIDADTATPKQHAPVNKKISTTVSELPKKMQRCDNSSSEIQPTLLFGDDGEEEEEEEEEEDTQKTHCCNATQPPQKLQARPCTYRYDTDTGNHIQYDDASIPPSATTLGTHGDRNGCSWSELPRFMDEEEWRPVAARRELCSIRVSLEKIAQDMLTCCRRKRKKQPQLVSATVQDDDEAATQQQFASMTTKQERVVFADQIRSECEKMKQVDEHLHSCFEACVCATMRCARSSELVGNGILIDASGGSMQRDLGLLSVATTNRRAQQQQRQRQRQKVSSVQQQQHGADNQQTQRQSRNRTRRPRTQKKKQQPTCDESVETQQQQQQQQQIITSAETLMTIEDAIGIDFSDHGNVSTSTQK